jgi:hypothetical protein
MKVKLKFDLNSIQQFLIRHAEKFVFGGAILALVLIVWSSMGKEQIDLTPEQLMQTAGNAQDMVDRTLPKPTRQATLYSEVAKKIRQDISQGPFVLRTDPDPPVSNPARQRPPLPASTVEALRAAAGHGAAMSTAVRGDVAQNRGTQGIRWAVLTGLIPLQKQYKDAFDTYSDTLPPFDPARDIPLLVWFQVQRAEVRPGVDLEHPEWKDVSVKKAMAFYNNFRGTGREVVSEIYIYSNRDFSSVFPPPPMGEEFIWGEELAHMPKIPRLASREEELMHPTRPGGHVKTKVPKPTAAEEKPESPKPDVPEEPDKPDDGPPGEGPNPPVPGGPPAEPMVRPMPRGPMVGGPMVGGPPKSGMPITYVPAGGGPRMPGRMGGGSDAEEASERLFRFFDFTVQPGKQYRYRVQLWWTNPNYGIPSQYLATADDTKQQWVKAEWSLPCEPVAVPRDSRVLAGEATKPAEQCKVGIAYFDITSGSEAFDMLDVARGQWLNFYGKTLKSVQPGLRGPMPMGPPPPDRTGPRKAPLRDKASGHGAGTHSGTGIRPPPPPPPHPATYVPEHGSMASTELADSKVDYVTDSLLLDVSGGGRIHGKDISLKEPAHVLLLDPQGNLVVLHELTDEEEIKNLLGTNNGPVTQPTTKPRGTKKTKETGDNIDSFLHTQPPAKKSSYSSKKSGKGG